MKSDLNQETRSLSMNVPMVVNSGLEILKYIYIYTNDYFCLTIISFKTFIILTFYKHKKLND